MSFRAEEVLERNELVRFQLDNAIRIHANGQDQEKMDINSQLIIDHQFLIGIILILKYDFDYKN